MNIRTLSILAFTIYLTLCAGLSQAVESPLAGISNLSWQQVRGQALAIQATSDDVIYALGQDQKVYRWRAGRGWLLLPGEFTALIIDSANKPWGIDIDGKVRRYNGLWWDDIETPDPVLALSANWTEGGGAKGVLALTTQGDIFGWTEKERGFKKINTLAAPVTVKSFIVESDAQIWVLRNNGKLFVRAMSGNSAVDAQIVENITDLSVTSAGSLVAVTMQGKLLELSNQRATEVAQLPYPVDNLTFAGADAPWFIANQGRIYTTTSLMPADKSGESDVVPVNQEQSSAVSQSSAADKKEAQKSAFIAGQFIETMYPELRFIRVSDASMLDLEVTESGSVFAVTENYQVERWRNRFKDFSSFPGTAKKLASDNQGMLWVINPIGTVYRLEDNRWVAIDNFSAEQIVATGNGDVYAINNAQAVYRFNQLTRRFDRVSRLTATDIDSDSEGNLWILASTGRLQKCRFERCETIAAPSVKSFDIGPDNSFFIVTQRDELYRRIPDAETAYSWQFIRRGVKQVSVGPSGYPWITDSRNQVYYSALFERDETDDRRIALAIQGSTLEEDSPAGITVSRRIRFTQSQLPATSGAGSFEISSHGNGELFLSIRQASQTSGGTVETYVNTHCLNDPFDSNCGFPEFCPDTTTSGCEPCNTEQNQSSSFCTQVENGSSVSQGDWINGFCLAQPQNPGCGFLAQPGSADQVDCSVSENQTHTVCVQYGNSIASNESAAISIAQLYRYDDSAQRFRETKLPEDAIDFSLDDKGRLLFVLNSELLMRETSAGSGRFIKVRSQVPVSASTQQAGFSSPQITAGSDHVFLLNNEGRLYLSESGSAFTAEGNTPLITDIQSDSQGRLWAISGNRVVLREDNSEYSLKSDYVADGLTGLTTAVTGDIYVVIKQRIARLNRSSRRFETIQGSYPDVRSLGVNKNGKLWLISTDGRLFKQI